MTFEKKEAGKRTSRWLCCGLAGSEGHGAPQTPHRGPSGNLARWVPARSLRVGPSPCRALGFPIYEM